jgi:Flp pilus assembly protein TadD
MITDSQEDLRRNQGRHGEVPRRAKSAAPNQFSLSQGEAPSPEQRLKEGEALLRDAKHEAALAIADAVLAEQPGHAAAWLMRGSACKALLRFAEAAEAYRFILGLFPEFTQMRLNLANALIELGAFAAAESELLEAVAQAPSSAAAQASLGSLYMRLDRYDMAEAPCREALRLDPALITAHQNLAAILALRDDPEAELHRDEAYNRQQIFVENAPGAERTVLILTASGSGNVPYQHLLPRGRYNRILWHVAYAPEGQAPPPHDFVFNAIGDPDVTEAALNAASRYAASCARPLLNRPGRIARTQRSAMPELLGGIADVVVPGTRRFTRGGVQDILASGLAFPLILRPAGRHGGQGARLVRSPEDLAAQIPDCEAFYATEFVNYRSADSWFRKYRAIFVDREPFPYHLAIGARWLLHYKTAEMQDDAARRNEEAAFLRDPLSAIGARGMSALVTIAERLDLDYAGIDFSILPDGRLLFFEANATMLVHPEDEAMFAYKNAAVDAITAAMDALIASRLAGVLTKAA